MNPHVVSSVALVSAFLVAKFVLMFLLPYWVFWVVQPSWAGRFRIANSRSSGNLTLFELKFSLSTLAMSLLVFLSIFWFSPIGGQGYTLFALHWGFGEKGIATELMAVVGYLVFYDAYFYWSHRLLHVPWLFQRAHYVHHRSLNPSPLSAYSFHPLEAVVNLLYFYPVLWFLPMSVPTLVGLILLSDLGNLGGHLGYDFFPARMRHAWWGRWLTTPTHHNLHHQLSRWNFGLYWSGWDRLFGTESPGLRSLER